MNALIVALGSSGDIHPMTALGIGLKVRGHRVTILANGHFGPVFRRAGLDHVKLGTAEEFTALIERPEVWDPVGSIRPIVEEGMLGPMRPTFEFIERWHVPGDSVVLAPPIALGARVAQEALGVPLVTVALHPSLFRSEVGPSLLPPLPLSSSMPRPWNRAWYWLADVAVLDRLIGPGLNAFRAVLGLPSTRRILDGWWFSPERVLGLFPDWFAPPQPGWPEQTRLVGFPLFDGSGVVPLAPEVEAFLIGGEPPLVFTPGSANCHAQSFFEEAVDASRRLGRRAALVSRFGDQIPNGLPEGVHYFDSVPFGLLFPRSAAVIHHGGIGTTALSLAAGIPQLIMPMAYDQPDNAARLTSLGVARSIAPRRFRSPAVAEALDRLLRDPEVSSRCRVLADRISEGDPLGRCLDLIEEVQGSHSQLP